MNGTGVCGCLVEALAVLAVDPATEAGRCCVCPSHTQLVVWDGARWRWSNQSTDIEVALRPAEGRAARVGAARA
ncbi:hypothetical protein [Streptomyces sp. NPDC088360]|uniref:hypothetical protein n=1 Tax=Streptomyces sp. NPDC088360 TaxID=3154515 RepID=UPI003450E8A6